MEMRHSNGNSRVGTAKTLLAACAAVSASGVAVSRATNCDRCAPSHNFIHLQCSKLSHLAFVPQYNLIYLRIYSHVMLSYACSIAHPSILLSIDVFTSMLLSHQTKNTAVIV